jgi:putative hydrolase of HD superfamily
VSHVSQVQHQWLAGEYLANIALTEADSGLLTHNSTSSSEQWTPQTVLSSLPAHSQPKPNTSSPVAFFHMLERLKTTKREGWRRFGINHGESISDHMYRMSIITMLCPASLRLRIDMNRCIKMALVHDMAELLVGDITPVDGVLKSEKNRRESTTMDFICKDLLGSVDGGDAGKEIKAAWQEYEDSETLESHFVHDVDKVELVLQMLEYEKSHEGRIDLTEFTHVASRIVLPEVREWCDQALEDRKAYWKSIGKEPKGMTAEIEKPEMKKMQDQYYSNGHKH